MSIRNVNIHKHTKNVFSQLIYVVAKEQVETECEAQKRHTAVWGALYI